MTDGTLSVRDDLPLPPVDGPILSSVQRTSTYQIHVTSEESAALAALAQVVGARTVAVITDETVDALYARHIAQWLADQGLKVHRTAIPAGEQSKSLPTASLLLDWLSRTDFQRRDVLLAIGGGVVTDTVGWVASAYMRGVAYVNVPTTLLAQVDAAIGGKVAVNHDLAKNLIGSFHAPNAVVSCTEWLRTLDARQINSGLAEAVKLAVIASPQLFAFLEQNLRTLQALDRSCLRRLVHAASAFKCALVERDPYELDLRRSLNLGHTVAHAVETVTGYGPVLHGEAVAYGTVVAVRVASARGVLPAPAAARVAGLLRALDLPLALRDIPGAPAAEHVVAALDKLRHVRDGSLRFVLPTGIGSVLIVDDVRDEEIRAALDDGCGRSDLATAAARSARGERTRAVRA